MLQVDVAQDMFANGQDATYAEFGPASLLTFNLLRQGNSQVSTIHSFLTFPVSSLHTFTSFLLLIPILMSFRYPTSAFAAPDVFDRGEMLWPRGIGLDAACMGLTFFREVA